VIDCGAEEARAIKCENGLAKDFVTNDKCAAGAGAAGAAFFAKALAEKFKK
jgi:activator of 2-hydroxyglutaryl-CoA dehydratase